MASSNNSISIVINAQDQASSVIGGMVNNFQSGMRTLSVQAAAVGASLTAFAKSSTDYLDTLYKSSKSLSTQTGMTIEQSSSLIQAFHRLGLTADQANTSFKIFDKTIQSARDTSQANSIQTEQLKNKIDATKIAVTALTDQINKNGDASGALHVKLQGLNLDLASYQDQLNQAAGPLAALNVATQNANGTNRNFNDILLSVADRFKEMPDGAQKTSLALELFGRSGAQMIKVLNQGSQGIQDLEAQAQKLGLTLNANNVGAIQAYIQSQKDLSESTNSMKIQVGTLTAPVMTKFNETLNSTIQRLVGVDAPFRNVTADVLAFGGPVASATAAAAGFLGNVGSMPKVLSLANVAMLAMNPLFIVLAAAVVGVTITLRDMRREMGSWSAVARVVQTDIEGLANRVRAFLQPSFVALFNTIEHQVYPTMKRLWKEVIEPLVPVIGTTFVLALRITVDTLNALLHAVTPVITFMLDHKQVVIDFAAAFTALGIAMRFEAIQAAFAANMSAIMGSITAVRGAVTGLYATIAAGTVMGGIAVAGALADIALVSQAVQSVLAAINQMNNARNAVAQAADQASAIQDIEARYKAGKINKTQEMNAINALLKGVDAAVGQANKHALGTNFAPGGLTLLGENGPEFVNLPRGSQVTPARETQQMLAGGGKSVHVENYNVYNQADPQRILRDIGWRLANA